MRMEMIVRLFAKVQKYVLSIRVYSNSCNGYAARILPLISTATH